MIEQLFNEICQIYDTVKDKYGVDVMGTTPVEVRAAFEFDHRVYPKYNTEKEFYDVVIYLPVTVTLDMESKNRYKFKRKGGSRVIHDYTIAEIRNPVNGKIHHYEVSGR